MSEFISILVENDRFPYMGLWFGFPRGFLQEHIANKLVRLVAEPDVFHLTPEVWAVIRYVHVCLDHIHLRAHALPHAHTWYHVIFSNDFVGTLLTPRIETTNHTSLSSPSLKLLLATTGCESAPMSSPSRSRVTTCQAWRCRLETKGKNLQQCWRDSLWLARPCWTKLGNQMVNTKGTKLVPPCILNFDPYPYDRWTWNVASGNAKSTHRGCQEYHQKCQSFFVTRQRPRNRALHT